MLMDPRHGTSHEYWRASSMSSTSSSASWMDDAEASGWDGGGGSGDWPPEWLAGSTLWPVSSSVHGANASLGLSPQSEAVLAYFRIATTCVMSVILVVGITGNVLVPIVIAHSKDLRNSTNVFLVNLALADLLVILICLPTGFVELHSTPGAWYLGETMCLVVTFVELIAPHASVLTILAISFERYYAICQPLRAGYVCTKSRAMAISLFTWLCAGILTSPIIGLTEYAIEPEDMEPSCGPARENFWTKFYFTASFTLFFLIPCIILLVLYALIAQHLIREPGRIGNPSTSASSSSALMPSSAGGSNGVTALGAVLTPDAGSVQRQPRRRHRLHRHQNSNRARRQVVAMLGAVVVSFFTCLLPFRLLTIIDDWGLQESPEYYYVLVNFCRIMVYLNSAVNPILYNLMSSKFRNGFLRLFGLKKFSRQGTVTSSSVAHTNTTSSSAALANANASLAPYSHQHRTLAYRVSSQPPE